MIARKRFTGSIAWVVFTTLLLSACSIHNLNFKADTRLDIVSPKAREVVALPVTFEWRAKELPTGSHVAVFVDRSPMKPGQSLDALIDKHCRTTEGCVTADYLAEHGIYIPDGNRLTVSTLPDTNAGEHHQLKETQRFTIVYLDQDNRRVSESAFEREYFLERNDNS